VVSWRLASWSRHLYFYYRHVLLYPVALV